MSKFEYPSWFKKCMVSHEEAMAVTIKSGTKIASGFATNEPHQFYDTLWDHIQENDLHDLNICQALFMAPHRICLGDTMQSKGMFNGASSKKGSGVFSKVARKANAVTKKLEGLSKLISHYKELKERKIVMTSPFIGAVTNMIIPPTAITSALYPEYVGRNTTRMGITDMQSIHFPDALYAMGYDADDNPKADVWVQVMTTPNENGEMSYGPANGANGEVTDKILEQCDVKMILYVNPNYPFTRGYNDAKNTHDIEEFKALAEKGFLWVVEDDSKIPALPANSFDNPGKTELAIAENVVNHIELNKHYTYGKAIQVGFGGTGVLAIRALKESSWVGRNYTEMLEPFTMDLFEAGKIKGSHFIEKNGTRTELDGKMVCTFTLAEENSDFYKKIDNNPDIVISTASRVVIPEGFYYGLGINNCLSIDFQGHVNSGGRFHNHHSGVGGGATIHRGLGRGGVGYLCLKSTYKGFDGRDHSAIMPFMPGSPISHIGPDLMGGREKARFFVVTEFGVTQVSGKSQSEFVKSLISIAHPKFKDSLAKEAYKEFRIVV